MKQVIEESKKNFCKPQLKLIIFILMFFNSTNQKSDTQMRLSKKVEIFSTSQNEAQAQDYELRILFALIFHLRYTIQLLKLRCRRNCAPV